LIIKVEINDAESVEEVLAVGAKDLKEHFLPKAGIYPEKVSISHITEKERQKMLRGEEYKCLYEEC
jgi:hypothetical protein